MRSKQLFNTRWIIFLVTALLLNPAFAESYTSPSGYLQVIGYKLKVTHRSGQAELAVSGWVQALADCKGAMLLFDVMEQGGKKVGTFKTIHGPFFRHDRWDLDPGVFTPEGGDMAKAIAAAHNVVIREADCTKRR